MKVRIRKSGPLFVCLFAASLLPAAAFGQHYTQTNLVSDISGTTPDTNLVNPWGLTRGPATPFWVSNNGTGTSTLYDGLGNRFPAASPLIVTVPPPKGASANTKATPTGVVFNGSQDFAVAPGKPALFIFVTEDGTISGWNATVDLHNAILMKDNSKDHAVYKGATIAEFNGKRYLYVANFHSGHIEVYDSGFNRVTLKGDAFSQDEDDDDGDFEPSRSRDLSPFNVQNVGGNLVVTYAKPDEARKDDVKGAGLGAVAIFTPGGKLLARLQHGDWLNAPWGVALAPSDFGEFSHALLIGNFGSGQVAAYNPFTLKFMGLMRNPDDSILTIDGLWALVFGNGANSAAYNALFFTAGIQDEAHGLFGSIKAVAAEQDGDEM